MKARPVCVVRARILCVDDFVGAKIVDLLLDEVDVAFFTLVQNFRDVKI